MAELDSGDLSVGGRSLSLVLALSVGQQPPPSKLVGQACRFEGQVKDNGGRDVVVKVVTSEEEEIMVDTVMMVVITTLGSMTPGSIS